MAGLVRWNPWSDLFSLHDQMDQLFGQVFGDQAAPRTGATEYSNLPVDIRQTDDAFLIEASVPGFTPEQVEVTFEDGVLTIRGERSNETETSQKGYVRRERRMSSVFRQIGLPADVRSDDISATFENGVLTVTVPRMEKAQPKRIPVNSTAPKVVDAPSTN